MNVAIKVYIVGVGSFTVFWHTGLFESGCEAVRWAEPPPETFELRVGPDYKANRLKGVSGPAL